MWGQPVTALRADGHEVAIATGDAVADDLERLGVPVLRLPDVLAPHQIAGRPDLVADATSVLELPSESELMTSTVAALGALPVRAVVALGSERAVAAFTGPRPANVHLVSVVQRRLLLRACDLFLTHAGFSGVREALTAGVPMVALPLFADQPANAARVDALGLGVRVEVAGRTSESLAAALAHVLDGPRYRLAAKGFQRRILGLPPLDAFAADLATLVRAG